MCVSGLVKGGGRKLKWHIGEVKNEEEEVENKDGGK